MTEKKEYIEREALIQRLAVSPLLSQMRASCFLKEGVLDIIQKFPAADVVEVVRCRDCKHFTERIGAKIVERAVKYKADFVYKENGETVVEDTKGVKTKDYIIKRKLMLWVHGISIREV